MTPDPVCISPDPFDAARAMKKIAAGEKVSMSR